MRLPNWVATELKCRYRTSMRSTSWATLNVRYGLPVFSRQRTSSRSSAFICVNSLVPRPAVRADDTQGRHVRRCSHRGFQVVRIRYPPEDPPVLVTPTPVIAPVPAVVVVHGSTPIAKPQDVSTR